MCLLQRCIIASILILLILAVGLVLTGCDSGHEGSVVDLSDRISDDEYKKLRQQTQSLNHDNAMLRFGFDLRASPQEDARQYLPFIRYLEQVTGYSFELHFTSLNSSIIDDLGAGHTQFAAIGADTFIRAYEKYGVISLVRGINNQGKAEYQSMIVVSPTSPIKNISELKGKRFAFGSVSSTQGTLIPQIILRTHGIHLGDLAAYEYTGSHENCADAVISKKFDACGMQDIMARDMEREGLLRILHTSKYYPSSGIAANQDLPPEVIAKVTQALLNFDPQGQHKQGLHNWDKTEMSRGFKAAMPADYAELREWSIKLGFVKPAATNND